MSYHAEPGNTVECGFSRSTGIFKVQIEGLYFFFLQFTGYNKDTQVQIQVDNKVACEAYSPDTTGSYQNTASCGFSQKLRKNQEVHVEVIQGVVNYVGGQHYQSQFHGFLVN